MDRGLPKEGMWKSHLGLAREGEGVLLGAVVRQGPGPKIWRRQGAQWEEWSRGLPTAFSCGGSVAFGDFNEDGLLDALVAGHCGGVSLYLGNGKGEWQGSPRNVSKTDADVARIADLNGDGHLDVVVLDWKLKGNGATLYLGDGKGGFREVRGQGLPEEGGAHDLLVRDLNGDGKPDLALPGKDGLWVYYQKPGGWEQAKVENPLTDIHGLYWGIAAWGEEILVGGTTTGVLVYRREGGVWRVKEELTDLFSVQGVAAGHLGFPGRGFLLALGTKDRDRREKGWGLYVFEKRGGKWTLLKTTGLPDGGLGQGWFVSAFDLDGDGKEEIFAAFGGHDEKGLLKVRTLFKEEIVREKSKAGLGVWKFEEEKTQ
jgi:hypothetical protein